MTKINIEKITEYYLEWFFCYSNADCGEKSNYSAMVACAYGSSPSDNYDPYSDATLSAVSKRNQINRKIKSLSIQDQRILEFSFGPNLIHPIVNAIFSKYSAAANLLVPHTTLIPLCYNSLTQNQLSKLITNYNNLLLLPSAKNRRQLTPQEKQQLSNIRIEATNNYNKAILNFYKSLRNK